MATRVLQQGSDRGQVGQPGGSLPSLQSSRSIGRFRTARPVALVGYLGFTGGLEKIVADPKAIVTIDDRYFVYIGPDKALLKKLGFRFLDDSNH